MKPCQTSREVILVGNPNTGKTTLFNSLTGANEHVGNWHGVTVEQKAKVFDCLGEKVRLVDLPGIYSLSALSFEEQVAIDYLRAHPKSKVVNICDLNNLQRNLSLTLGLLELGADVILVVNKMDKHPLVKVDYFSLAKKLGIDVIEISAENKKGLDELKKLMLSPYKKSRAPEYVKKLLGDENDAFRRIKLLECDEAVIKELNEENKHKQAKAKLEDKKNNNILASQSGILKVAEARYSFIDKIAKSCFTFSGRVYGKSRLDKVVLNRFLAIPIFLLVLCGIFYLTFFSLGALLSDALSALLDISLASWAKMACESLFGSSSWITHLVCDAIIGGVGTVLTFLPQVGLLFLFLSILEDSGYLSRVAFAAEDIFGKLGLSGKSIYTLLMGFGCSTTAVLTARNMEDKNSKIKTALLTPYMSCSAKFPIYVVIGSAFFGASNVFVIMGLYMLGLVVSLLLSFVLDKTVLKSKAQSFILEFPPYRFGGAKRLLGVLWQNIRLFLVRVGSLLISMNVIVWLLSNFSIDFSFVPDSGKMSMLEGIGGLLAPIFVPLGFGNWGAASALVAGVIAKEIIVSSIAMFNGVGEEGIGASLHNSASMIYFATPASAASFLVFSLLYLPCVSTMAVLGKEIGWKWTTVGIILQFVIAYIVTLFIYNVLGAILNYGFLPVLGVILAFIVIMLAIFKIVSAIKKPRKCSGCGNCKS